MPFHNKNMGVGAMNFHIKPVLFAFQTLGGKAPTPWTRAWQNRVDCPGYCCPLELLIRRDQTPYLHYPLALDYLHSLVWYFVVQPP